jgi:hypothetical protein
MIVIATVVDGDGGGPQRWADTSTWCWGPVLEQQVRLTVRGSKDLPLSLNGDTLRDVVPRTRSLFRSVNDDDEG